MCTCKCSRAYTHECTCCAGLWNGPDDENVGVLAEALKSERASETEDAGDSEKPDAHRRGVGGGVWDAPTADDEEHGVGVDAGARKRPDDEKVLSDKEESGGKEGPGGRAAGVGGVVGSVGGVVGGLLHGAAAVGGVKEGSGTGKLPLPRPSSFDSTMLSSVAGKCCYVIPGDYLMDGKPLVVHEDEPASIIALALSSKGYHQALVQTPDNPDVEREPAEAAAGRGEGGSGDATSKRSSTKSEEERRERPDSHVNVTFEAEGACGLAELSCKVYFARSFHELRTRYCAMRGFSDIGQGDAEQERKDGTHAMVSSLRRCKKWNPTGGRSGSAWLKTADERFVLKEISKREIAHFLKAAHEYFDFITTTMDSSPPIPSCLAKIFGLFKVSTSLKRNTGKSGSAAGASQVCVL